MKSKPYLRVNGRIAEQDSAGLAARLRDWAGSSLQDFEVLPARSGVATLGYRSNGGRVFLHSLYDPEREAEQFAEGQGIVPGDRVVIYGLGLGYHVRAALQRVGPTGTVVAVECNPAVAYCAWEAGCLRDLLGAPNLVFYLAFSPAGIRSVLLEALAASEPKFVVHGPSLRVLPQQLETVGVLLSEWKVRVDSMRRLGPLMNENLTANRETCASAPGVERLFGRFSGVPLFLLAAGPSLTAALPQLRRAAEAALLFAVGTAVKPMLAEGITPHLAVIADPLPVVARQLEGVEASFPLVFLATASKEAVACYRGSKLAAFQAGHPKVEALARELGRPLIETGGSVATAALDIAIRMGANPIVFVGQDLAYVGGRSHAAGTIHAESVGPIRSHIKAPGYGGEEVTTSTSWSIYRRWIERRIARERGRIVFVNTSLEGARIEGARALPLGEVLERFCRQRRPLREMISALLG